MANYVISIPDDMKDISMTMSDTLTIKFSGASNFCFDDSGGCFDKFPDAGPHHSGDPDVPMTPVAVGESAYNAVTSGDCRPRGPAATGHTITVTN